MPGVTEGSRCRLLELPDEIQSMIWEELVSPRPRVQLSDSPATASTLNRRLASLRPRTKARTVAAIYDAPFRAIFFTCKAIRDATQPLLASNSILTVPAKLLTLDRIPVDVQRAYFPKIRYLRYMPHDLKTFPRFEPNYLPELEVLELFLPSYDTCDYREPDYMSIVGSGVSVESKDQLWHHQRGYQDEYLIETWLQYHVKERFDDWPDWLYRELTPTLDREHEVHVIRPWDLFAYTAYTNSLPGGQVPVVLVSTVSASKKRRSDFDRSSNLILIQRKCTADALYIGTKFPSRPVLYFSPPSATSSLLSDVEDAKHVFERYRPMNVASGPGLGTSAVLACILHLNPSPSSKLHGLPLDLMTHLTSYTGGVLSLGRASTILYAPQRRTRDTRSSSYLSRFARSSTPISSLMLLRPFRMSRLTTIFCCTAKNRFGIIQDPSASINAPTSQ